MDVSFLFLRAGVWLGPSALPIYKTTLLDSLVSNWAWSVNLGPGPELGLRHEI